MLCWRGLTPGNSNPSLLQNPENAKDISQHVSSLSVPLFPNFASTVMPRLKLQKMENNVGNSVESPQPPKHRRSTDLGAVRILEC